ncbi:MAG: prepilin-type N-terminal cleavage/methylation domain-containing protein [Candidatus Gracilibacteria bacterium]|nr:prepilin-type N-terminal cleavage/methylation domain-containing protein [Candidatus Gracilibacteria bacterium]
MKKQTNKLGFTLIELLVVITIIGILSTGAVSVYTSQIQKARDTTRINDIKALQSGIEQFYQDTSVYPQGGADWLGNGSTSVMDYLPNLAEDPKHNQTCNGSRCGYVYNVGDDSVGIQQGSYEVSTAFENQGNVDNKAAQAQDNGLDNSRLELGLMTDIRNTVSAQDTSFDGTNLTNTDTSATIVIVKSGVDTK